MTTPQDNAVPDFAALCNQIGIDFEKIISEVIDDKLRNLHVRSLVNFDEALLEKMVDGPLFQDLLKYDDRSATGDGPLVRMIGVHCFTHDRVRCTKILSPPDLLPGHLQPFLVNVR